jgi:GTP-binding protein
VPNLGVVSYGDQQSFVVADIPGLIEGAHAGQGLGDKFLRHVMRTRVLIHLIDASNISKDDPLENWRAVNRELELFDPELIKKPQVVVASKIDLTEARANAQLLERKLPKEFQPLYSISAVTGEGVKPLVRTVGALLDDTARTKQQDDAEGV